MKEQKSELRKEITRRKKQFDPEELKSISKTLLERLENLPAFREADTVLLYHSLKDEVYTHEFAEKWKESKTLLLPVVVGDELELRRYTGKHDLHTGSYGIEEPTGELFTDFKKIDLAVIPGVSFDASGCRLGRGKGYYDRLLPKLISFNLGICFSFQVSEQIPTEEFDRKMNAVLTESQLWYQ